MSGTQAEYLSMFRDEGIPIFEGLHINAQELHAFRRDICGRYSFNVANPITTPAFDCTKSNKFVEKKDSKWSTVSFRYGPRFSEAVSTPSYVELVFTNSSLTNNRTCGGVIVHEDIVLTSARCLGGAQPYMRCRVRGGYSSSNDLKRYNVVQTRYAAGFCRMPHYNIETINGIEHIFNDIALIKLTEPFIYSPYVQPACLNLNQEHRSTAICHGVGFADTSREDGFSERRRGSYMTRNCADQDLPQFLNLTTASCYWPYNNEELGACEGDEGSPLYCWDNCSQEKIAVAVGLYSYGPELERKGRNCGLGQQASIYSDFFKVKDSLMDLLENCS